MKSLKYFTPEPESVKTYPDGRQVCQENAAGKREYKARITEMWLRQEGICPICGRWMDQNEATFEHEIPRGMGGGSRDDRTHDANGNELNFATHGRCNRERGSQRTVLSRVKEVA
jgi:hypothetical protein